MTVTLCVWAARYGISKEHRATLSHRHACSAWIGCGLLPRPPGRGDLQVADDVEEGQTWLEP